MTKIRQYAKALIATFGGALTVAVQTIPADTTAGRIIAAIVALLTAAGVYAVPNKN